MGFRKKRGLASSISFWVTVIFSISSAMMLILGLAVNIENQRVGSAIEVQLQELQKVQELARASQNIVASYRGFMAYGNTQFLDGIFVDKDNLVSDLNHIAAVMSSRGSEELEKASAATRIATIWSDLSDVMNKGIELKKLNDSEGIDLLSRTKGTPAVEEINSRFNELVKLQEDHVMDLVHRNKVLGYWLLMIPTAIILIMGILGHYLVSYLRKVVITPVLYMSSAVSQIASGRYVKVEDTGRPDELGDLQRGVLHMSEELKKRTLELESFNKELINQRDLLEAQNEEIMAQQEEQQDTLLKLTARESELELISSYQEKLAGYLDLEAFLDKSVPALLQVLGTDAAALILKREGWGMNGEELVYATGYPAASLYSGIVDLFGPSMRVFTEKQAITRVRELSGSEKGVFDFYDRALDIYFPLLDNDQKVFGLLLMTNYGNNGLTEQSVRINRGLIKQFNLALQAQILNEDRIRQGAQLERLNDELINEKLLLQQQRDLIRQINESIHEGMLMLDDAGKIIFANQRMESFFGYEMREGHTLQDFMDVLSNIGDRGAASIAQKVHELLAGKEGAIQERFEVADPSGSRYYELYVNAVEDAGITEKGYLLVFRDRTEEEKVDEMKNEFISIVSHELRTPLSSVLGFIEILLHRNVAPDKQKRYLETIHKEANRLSTLINDFLDLQRMESGKQVYQPVPCHIAELVANVAEQWQGKNGHTDRMTQVLHNLISNAIKYSPDSDMVDIICSEQGDMVRIDVQDYGLGIPEDAKDKLFSKFYRVDNSDRRQIGGTGLGLAIVKEIVEAHGGRLAFESKLGEGSTFTVLIPAYSHQDLSGKVVIVEDDENLAKMIAVAFEKLQVPTVRLSSAEDAMYSMNKSTERPILCIVDIQLQGVRSGWDFISELLEHPVHGKAPIIVSTVLEQPNHFYETHKERYLKKPFSIGRLLELAQNMITENQTAASVVFPVQDEQVITHSLQHNGIKVKEIKVNSDFIEVDIEKHGDA
jgi:PAS domain S-box-containing protein